MVKYHDILWLDALDRPVYQGMKMASHQVSSSEFVVVLRATAAPFFQRGASMRVKVPQSMGDLILTIQTRHLDRGLEHPIPGDLWIEARGPATSIEHAISTFGNAAATITPLIAYTTNASVGTLELELAFDSTHGRAERDFLQVFVPGERNLISRGRVVDIPCVKAVLASVENHAEKDRLVRAITQYGLSLEHWRLGHEILATAHLYMGVEALTKAVLRSRFGVNQLTDQVIATQLGIDPNRVDPRRLSGEIEAAVRSRIIFQADTDSYRNAKAASDGLEHGFLPFDQIREKARKTRNRTARYLRCAIVELLNLSPELQSRLTDETHLNPLGDWPLTKYPRGKLIAPTDSLASATNEYPIMTWRTNITSLQMNEKGEYEVKWNEKITPQLAENVSFRPTSIEVWAP
jgi:hypothetical protein